MVILIIDSSNGSEHVELDVKHPACIFKHIESTSDSREQVSSLALWEQIFILPIIVP